MKHASDIEGAKKEKLEKQYTHQNWKCSGLLSASACDGLDLLRCSPLWIVVLEIHEVTLVELPVGVTREIRSQSSEIVHVSSQLGNEWVRFESIDVLGIAQVEFT